MGFQSLFSAVFWNYFIINYHLALETDLTDTLTGTSVSQVYISSVITCHLALETDLTDTRRGTSVICHHLPRRTGDRLDRHSHRYICHLSSAAILPWKLICQTLSQVHLFSTEFFRYFIINYHITLETDLTDTLTGTSVICHHLPSLLGGRLDRHSRGIYSVPSSNPISSSTVTLPWRHT